MTREEAIGGSVVIPYAGLRPRQPLWVKLGLWGLSGRASAWVFVWVCAGIAVGCVVMGVVSDPWWHLGSMMLLASLWYWASIRWVDRHGGWSQVRE